nr:immunoglobulin light chain junction region [Macaca mulatta]MOW36920.1 immunoglobulin light chain junction region [Macaca mulatta]MOW37849.1 immunoglobulin light chain junction region [Macaca mulatta]MOW38154.1 immunoglobulin light chain junction region [Macaca mulatta]MOW38201.1 immunoglobulin light chain junction region [Macaca mulatta]
DYYCDSWDNSGTHVLF